VDDELDPVEHNKGSAAGGGSSSGCSTYSTFDGRATRGHLELQ
jgi:hypothetical protein